MSYRQIERLAAVREEFAAVQASLLYVERAWPSVHDAPEVDDTDLNQIRRAAALVEGTYLIRLFAEFEAILRGHLAQTAPERRVPGRAEHLINRVATAHRISQSIRSAAHEVREYRNSLVHDRDDTVIAVSFSKATIALNKFLAWLPS